MMEESERMHGRIHSLRLLRAEGLQGKILPFPFPPLSPFSFLLFSFMVSFLSSPRIRREEDLEEGEKGRSKRKGSRGGESEGEKFLSSPSLCRRRLRRELSSHNNQHQKTGKEFIPFPIIHQ